MLPAEPHAAARDPRRRGADADADADADAARRRAEADTHAQSAQAKLGAGDAWSAHGLAILALAKWPGHPLASGICDAVSDYAETRVKEAVLARRYGEARARMADLAPLFSPRHAPGAVPQVLRLLERLDAMERASPGGVHTLLVRFVDQ